VGIEIRSKSGPARPFCEQLMERGLLCKETHGQVIRLAPPLNIEEEDLNYAVGLLAEVLV
jgi:ornithine--oxo-acid transaminase